MLAAVYSGRTGPAYVWKWMTKVCPAKSLPTSGQPRRRGPLLGLLPLHHHKRLHGELCTCHACCSSTLLCSVAICLLPPSGITKLVSCLFSLFEQLLLGQQNKLRIVHACLLPYLLLSAMLMSPDCDVEAIAVQATMSDLQASPSKLSNS